MPSRIKPIGKTFPLDIVVSRGLPAKSSRSALRPASRSVFAPPVPPFLQAWRAVRRYGTVRFGGATARGTRGVCVSCLSFFFAFSFFRICFPVRLRRGVAVPASRNSARHAAHCGELRIFRVVRVFFRILFSGFVELSAILQYNVKQSETKPLGKCANPKPGNGAAGRQRLEN